MKFILLVVFYFLYSVASFAGLDPIQDNTVTSSSEDDLKSRVHKVFSTFLPDLVLTLLPNYQVIKNDIKDQHKKMRNVWFKGGVNLTDEDMEVVKQAEDFIKIHKIAENDKKYFNLFRIYSDWYKAEHNCYPTAVTCADLELIQEEYCEKLKILEATYIAKNGCKPKTVSLSDLENIQVE